MPQCTSSIDGVKIREAKSSEVLTLAEFQMQMAEETEGIALNPEKCRMGVQSVFDDSRRGLYFVAEFDGQVIASTLVIDEWSDWRNGFVWWIHSVYVLPDFRRKKIFRKMFEYIKDLGLQKPGFRGLRLFVEKHNERAQACYRALGMSSDRYDLYEWMTDY
jgi:GNAT superfamily N-acetyltransferase